MPSKRSTNKGRKRVTPEFVSGQSNVFLAAARRGGAGAGIHTNRAAKRNGRGASKRRAIAESHSAMRSDYPSGRSSF